MKIDRTDSVRGTVRVPGDKSIAHRALILGSITRGKQVIEGAPRSADLVSTMSCLRSLGTFIEEMPDGRLLVLAKAFNASETLDAGNSGTTVRLLSGLLAAQPFTTTIDGDDSLRRRPMERVAEPLTQMGAEVITTNGRLPMTITGGPLQSFHYRLPIPSAQVKSAVLLAGLHADGETVIDEPVPTRDHTERLLAAMGVPIERTAGRIRLHGGSIPRAVQVRVPGDISSAAFFIAAALCLDSSEIYLPAVGNNPTRVGLVSVLRSMGADIEEFNKARFLEEPIADFAVRSSKLRGIRIGSDVVPSLIDEIPILAVVATQADGETIVSGAGELRYKESDRIETIVDNLRKLGADIEARPDGFAVRGPTRLTGASVSSHGDHRIAMALSIAGLFADGRTEIDFSDAVNVSYPGFFGDLRSVTR